MLVYHDDARREYAYGPAGGLPETHVGSFPDTLMTLAKKNGWVVISMKKDWKGVFPSRSNTTSSSKDSGRTYRLAS